MDTSLIVLTLTMFWKLSSAVLQCYRCEAERKDPYTLTCDHFDYSAKYIVDCPDSTICYKKITSLKTMEAESETIERGCAIQKSKDMQEKVNGVWALDKKINEVYNTTCENDAELGRRTTTTKCYCRGDYCNGARRSGSINIFLAGFMILARCSF